MTAGSDDYEDIEKPPSLWTRLVREFYAWRTPPAPPLEEARARMAVAKPPFFTEEQKAALREIEEEGNCWFFPPPRRWWQRWL